MRPSKFIFIALIFAFSQSAYAQNDQRPQKPVDTGWTVSVGGGGIFSPKYFGDDEYDLSAVPYIRVTKGERLTATVQDGIRYKVWDQNNFQIGPMAKINFGRDEDGSGTFRISGEGTNDLLGLGDVDTTIELGGFAEYTLGDLALSAEIGKGLGGHNGITGSAGLRYKNRLTGYGPPLIYSIGPSIDFGDADYGNAFFGVDADQSVASGLDVFEAGGGIVSYGLGGTAILPLSEKMSATLIVNYKRLAGDAADAPLVTNRGSQDQFFAGAFLAYTF